VEESMALVLEDLRGIDDWRRNGTGQYRQLVTEVIGRRNASEFLASVREAILSETLDETSLRQCIHLTLIAIQRDIDHAAPLIRREVL
jgi:hypothetical protein